MDIRMSNIASPMPQIRAKFTNKLGIPLSGCKVYTYEPNSDIPKTTWLDTDKTVENTNPILLDAAGEADIFLDGLYRVVVKDQFGFAVYDVEKTGGHAQWDASSVVDASELTQQQINNATLKHVVSTAELLTISNPPTGWAYKVLENGTTYKFDPAQVGTNNGGTILNGWVAQGLRYVTPEMFGADPTGTVSSRLAIRAMLNSLSVGGVIECKPNATYYNDAPNGTSDTWVINQNKTYIIANGATFKRRPTAVGTASIDHDLASLRVTGKNVTIEGKVYFDGSEIYAPIVNSSNAVLVSGDYARGYASSHGLHLFGADYFTALQVYSKDAVFNIFANGSVGVNIKGRCKSSGQVYPVTGVDLNLGSGIKLAYCTDYDIDLYTEYAGYCGVEVEPACRFGRVNSVARWPTHHGVSFHDDCEGATVTSVAENCQLGGALRLGAGSRQITGTFSAKDSHIGLCIEPSSTDATITGDVTLCDVKGTSLNSRTQALYLVNNAIGGKLRESSIKVRSRNDGSGTASAMILENASECDFDIGIKSAKQALVVNKIHKSKINIAYMEGITDANPMFFTADNTVDLTCKIGGALYRLNAVEGIVEASSLATTISSIPVVNYFAIDVRASNYIAPSLPTSAAAAVSNGLWVDTVDANTIKRKS